MSGRLLCELGDTIYRQAKPKSGCEHAVTAQFFGASVESSLAPVQRQAVQAHTGCTPPFSECPACMWWVELRGRVRAFEC